MHLESKSLKTYLTIASLSAHWKTLESLWISDAWEHLWNSDTWQGFLKFWIRKIAVEFCCQYLRRPVCEPARQGWWLLFFWYFGAYEFLLQRSRFAQQYGSRFKFCNNWEKESGGWGWNLLWQLPCSQALSYRGRFSCVHYTSFHGPLWLMSKVHSARLHVVHP